MSYTDGFFIFKLQWTVIRKGGLTYVTERILRVTRWQEFGPICPLLAEAFVEERKAYYRALVAARVPPTFELYGAAAPIDAPHPLG